MELGRADFNRFEKLVIIQLLKLKINKSDYDDFIQECFLYILRRKGKIDLGDKYIYGDISNAIFNYVNKLHKYNKLLYNLSIEKIPDIFNHYDRLNIQDYIEDILLYDYGYLVIYNRLYGYSIKELSDIFNLSESKVYYEIDKIAKEFKEGLE